MTDLTYDPALVETVAMTLDLRAPNRDALDTLAQELDTADHGAVLVADLATGVGKTYIAAGLLDYLYGSGVRNVVIVTPGSTIQRKTVANLTPGSAKYVRGLQCRPVVVTLDGFENGQVAGALEDPTAMKVFVFTVQSLLRPNTKENRRAHRDHETLGQSLTDHLRRAEDLVVIADEHHIYAGSAKKFAAAIADLDPTAVVGLTATPDPSTPADQIVFRYPLAASLAAALARKDAKDAEAAAAPKVTEARYADDGTKVTLTATMTAERGFETMYGWTNVYVFTADGHRFEWLTKCDIPTQVGDTVTLTGKVKGINEYHGTTTVLTRCKINT